MPGLVSEQSRSTLDEFLESLNFQSDAIKVSTQVLDVIRRYKCPPAQGILDRSDEGALRFLGIVYRSVKLGEPVRMVLPAFPFKSPNNETKVLGTQPDKAEEFALAHLHGMCKAIEDIYPPGAKLTIVSDGLVYSDLLGVPDRIVWSYGQRLRYLSEEKGYSSSIQFARLKDLLAIESLQDAADEMTYVGTAPSVRMALLRKYGRDELDEGSKQEAVSANENTRLTYCGYLKFLETDLALQYPLDEQRSRKSFRKGLERIAKAMLKRGDAFARAVRENYPNHVRLSIHPSTGEDKISINVLPLQVGNFDRKVTPWHCCIAFKVDGTMMAGHRHTFEQMPNLELVRERGLPSYFRERSHLYEWSSDVVFTPQYPCGLIVTPVAGKRVSIIELEGPKIRDLSMYNSPVILRGFSRTRDRELFISKAKEMGEPQSWKFGLILEVKDRGSETGGLNNVLSQEWMPFHFDGLFKTESITKEDGSVCLVPKPPRFQLFTAITPSSGDGYTLFSSSKLVIQHLPQDLPLSHLENLTWSVSTKSFDQTALTGLSLITTHPETGQPCLRYHERWPQHKTRFDPTEIRIENGSQSICDVLESLLHDRRICYYHTWSQGDILVSDNLGMMHTRSSFTGKIDRELWRIHLD